MIAPNAESGLQLASPGTQPRLWMFCLCVLLPNVTTVGALFAVRQGRTHWDFFGGSPLHISLLILSGTLVLTLALWLLLDRLMHRHRLEFSSTSLEVKTSFYSQSVPFSEMKLDHARVVDLQERSEFNPGLKSNGYSVPGFRSGYFRLRGGSKAFVAIAGERLALWLPTTRERGLLLQPRQPEALLNRLRALAASLPRR